MSALGLGLRGLSLGLDQRGRNRGSLIPGRSATPEVILALQSSTFDVGQIESTDRKPSTAVCVAISRASSSAQGLKSVHWKAAPLPGPAVDSYVAGDSFAAGLTYALAQGRAQEEAVAFGARCGRFGQTTDFRRCACGACEIC
jgi:hypothetical protein